MSKTTYAMVTFKLRFEEGATDPEIVQLSRKVTKQINQIIEENDGELCTLNDVLNAAAKGPESRIGTMSFEAALKEDIEQ